MKKYLFLLLASGFCHAQIVFSDANLKAMLLAASPNYPVAFTEASFPNSVTIDTDGDGEIQLSEAQLITRICFYPGFTFDNLEGLQYFTNLEEFRSEGGTFNTNDFNPINQVKRLWLQSNYGVDVLNISAFSQLEELDASLGNVGSIVIGTLPNLSILRIPANYLSSLDVSGVPNLTVLDFSDASGFQFVAPDVSGFVHLTELGCAGVHLTSLDVSAMPNLTILHCRNNDNLGTLDVSNLTNLKELDCSRTGLTSLDVSMLTQLEKLNISQNQIPAVNITSGANLKELNINATLINQFDATPFPSLQLLNCGNGASNPMTSLTLVPSLQNLYVYGYDATNFTISLPVLSELNLQYTTLHTIDYSACPMLNFTYFYGNLELEYLNAKNGNQNQAMPSIMYSPNLLMVCTNEHQVDSWQMVIPFGVETNPDCQVNSYCSFTPGGVYNTINGKIRFDNEDDGCDANDVTFPHTKVTLNDEMQSGIAFSTLNGDYKFYTQTTGDFSLTAQMENPSYYNITPAPAMFNLTTIDGSTTTADFCITANGIHPDAEVMIVPIGQARPGFDANYQLVYRNKGNKTLSGWISVTFDDARTDFVSANPMMTQTGNTLIFSYSDLSPFETRSADFTINLNGPMETPALNDGDILHFETNMNYAIPDVDAFYTTADLNQIIVNSLDPNDKTCLEGNTISPDMIGNYVHYNINFENIGTAEAVNVVVKDQIDAAKFDISTLQVIYASHPVVTRITGNRVDFIFENINLPGTSGENKGNVLFKIKTKPTLVLGNTISNKAEIFFDYNFPIETNEATSTFAILKNNDFVADATIGIYPNPTKSKINVKADSNIKSLQLFDMQGRVLQTLSENSKDVSIDISGKQNGIYFLNVTTEKGTKVEKLVKE